MITGSVPTDNLPRKSHDVPKQERRTLVRTSVKDMPSTSTSSVSLYLPALTDADRIKPWIQELDEETILPWKVEKCEDNVKFELYDGIHDIAKYTVIINTTLDFSIYTFHWPIPENHTICLDKKRSMGGKDIKELLTLVENANLCEGLPVADDDIKSVAVDPNTGITVHTPGTIVRHSVPKLLSETQFEASIYFRSADCHVIQDNSNNEEEPCGPCSIARNALKRAQRRKKKIS